jgi:hypothetical protein
MLPNAVYDFSTWENADEMSIKTKLYLKYRPISLKK